MNATVTVTGAESKPRGHDMCASARLQLLPPHIMTAVAQWVECDGAQGQLGADKIAVREKVKRDRGLNGLRKISMLGKEYIRLSLIVS